jgi:hypothetical protein
MRASRSFCWCVLAAVLLCMMSCRAEGQCANGQCRVPVVGAAVSARVAPATLQYVEPAGRYRSVVRVQAKVGPANRRLGSGVCVRWVAVKVVLTAGHMARGAKEVAVWLAKPKRWATAKILKVDNAWDVALLGLSEVDAAELVASDIAWGDEATPDKGTKLTSCGLGADGRLATNTGTVIDYLGNGASGRQADWMEMSGRAREGDSGGPVFDAKDQVVGILWGTDDRTVTATQAGYLHKVLVEALGPWIEQPKAEMIAANAIEPVPTDETCRPDGLIARLRGKATPTPSPSPPPVVVQSDPEIRKGLTNIEGTLGVVAQNTAPRPVPPAPEGVPDWAKALCVAAALAVGFFIFYVVQQN